MAQNIELIFEGGGSLVDDLRALAEASKGVADANKQAQAKITEDLSRSSKQAQELSKNMDQAAKVVVALGKSAASEGPGRLEGGLKKAATAAGALDKSIAQASGTASSAGQQAQRGLQQAAQVTTRSSQQASRALQLTAEQYAIVREEARAAGIEGEEFAQALAEAVAELAAAGVQAEDLNGAFEPTVKSAESLQRELRKAKLEAGQLAAEFGLDSEQAIEAQKRVGQLTDEVGDLKARFDAFNPDAKFQALNSVVSSLQGGLFGVQSILNTFAGGNETLNKVFSGIQGILFASQGIQTFVGGLGDSLKTLRATLLGAAAAQEAQTAAAASGAAANTAAGAAATGASGGFRILTTSVKAFTVSLLTNPIFLAVAAITALGAIILFAGDEAETAAEKTSKWLDTFNRVDDARRRTNQLLASIRDARREGEDIDIGNDLAGQASAAARRAKEDIDILNAEVDRIFADQQRLIAQANNVGIVATRGIDAATGQATINVKNLEDLSEDQVEALKNLMASFKQLGDEARDLSGEARVTQIRAANEQRKLQKQIEDQARETARTRREIARSLADDLVSIEADLARRLLEAQAERGGDRAQLELERRNAQEEIDEIERGFARKLALIELQKRLSVEAWQSLGDAERNARADALVASGNVGIPVEEQEKINTLRILAEERYFQQLDTLVRNQAKERLDLIRDSSEREREAFEIGLEERLEALKKARASEAELDAFAVSERDRFEQEAALKSIALDQQIAEARINARLIGGQNEAEFEREKQQELLAVREAAAQASLAAIKDDGTAEAQLLRLQFEGVIAEVDAARRRLEQNVPERSLLSLLGVKPEDEARVRESLNSLLQSSIQIAQATNAARQEEVRQQIAATDAIIGDAQRRRSELQAELDRALADQKEGYANNADAIRAQIEQTRIAEREALEEKKRQILEQQRLARQQVLIDAASQASALAVSVANLIKTWSTLPFGVGLVAAFAQAASIAAFVTSTNARLKQAAAGPQFRKGGVLGDGVLIGPSHEAGGIALFDRRSGAYYGEAEGGEGIVSRPAMAERGDLVKAINARDIGRVHALAIKELQAAGHMVIPPTLASRARTAVVGRSGGQDADMLAKLIDRVDSLTEEVRGFRAQENNRERSRKDGTTTVSSTPNRKVTYR